MFCQISRLAVLAGLLIAVALPGVGADWPQFQGPNRDGFSPETGIARVWPEAGPKVLWEFPLGEGYAGPSVRDGEVYVLDREEAARDILRCIDLNSGKELWNFTYEAPGSAGHNGSRTPVTVDAEYTYSVGMMGDFYCVDRKTHEPVWHHNLLKEYGVDVPRWGVSQSPLLYKDWVILAPQGAEGYVAAYDKKTGAAVWETKAFGLVGYCSPVILTLDGVEQLVMIGAGTKDKSKPTTVAGLSLADGSMLWQYQGWSCYIPIPVPTLLPDDRLFITGGYTAGSAMIQVKKDGAGFAAKELFTLDMNVCGSQIQQPIFYQDHLYVNSNSNERTDGLCCFALDGTCLWSTAAQDGLPTFDKGDLILVEGVILMLDGKEGTLHMIDPSPEGYKEIARCSMLKGKEIWAPMALSEGKLVIRDQANMKCLDLVNP